MNQQICYASIAIYSKHNAETEITSALGISPSRTGERNGTFSWIYSSQGLSEGGTAEEHACLLKDVFEKKTSQLTRLSEEGAEIRIWVYFGIREINESFVLDKDFVKWISLFDADIYVDVWKSS